MLCQNEETLRWEVSGIACSDSGQTLTWRCSATKSNHATTARGDIPNQYVNIKSIPIGAFPPGLSCVAEISLIADRRIKGRGWSDQQTIPSVGVLPPPFVEDEQVITDGINSPLLPPKPSPLLQQQEIWDLSMPAPDYWLDFSLDTQSPRDTAMEPKIPWQGSWAAVSGADVVDSPAEPTCGHTDVFHDSLILLNKRQELPAQFIQRWQSGRTDEILLWLVQQQSSLASSPSSTFVADQAHLPIPPTRQNAELLRVCKSSFSWALDLKT